MVLLVDIYYKDIMTCIVGIVDKSSSTPRIWMGADSGASDSDIILPLLDKKIQKVGRYLIGFAGETGLGQLIHSIDLPDPINVKPENLLKFLRLNFTKAIKDHMDIYSPIPSTPAPGDEGGVSLLIGVKGRLFEFDSSDFQLNEFSECAIGSGAHFAFGVLFASRNYKDQKKRVLKAIEASIEYSPSCIGPIDIQYIDK
jgi:ATP-dependent protease HslVU (ClpYQ) peptidase subunit